MRASFLRFLLLTGTLVVGLVPGPPATAQVRGLDIHYVPTPPEVVDAMLELAREKLVEFTQTEAFQPIYVRVHQGGTEPGQESA